jgi:hypothetical protein
VNGGIFATPRPVPSRLLPAIGGALVCALALPVVLLGGWSLLGWALGATLWVGILALDLLLARARGSAGNLAASGVLAFGLFFKAIAVLVVLFAAVRSDADVALTAVLVFGLAYTLDRGLQLAGYFGATR